VQVHCDEGVANHIGPEPCAGIREDVGEASVGEHIGQPLSRDRKRFRVPTPFQRRKATRRGAPSQALRRPGVVEDPGMCARSLYGNREISGLTSRSAGLARIGKAKSRSR
jgi:hypothetical protein